MFSTTNDISTPPNASSLPIRALADSASSFLFTFSLPIAHNIREIHNSLESQKGPRDSMHDIAMPLLQ